MPFIEPAPDHAAEIVAFIRRHGDAWTKHLGGSTDAETTLFAGQRIYGRRRAGDFPRAALTEPLCRLGAFAL